MQPEGIELGPSVKGSRSTATGPAQCWCWTPDRILYGGTWALLTESQREKGSGFSLHRQCATATDAAALLVPWLDLEGEAQGSSLVQGDGVWCAARA